MEVGIGPAFCGCFGMGVISQSGNFVRRRERNSQPRAEFDQPILPDRIPSLVRAAQRRRKNLVFYAAVPAVGVCRVLSGCNCQQQKF